MAVKTYREKPVEIQAMQVIIGNTTKTEILAFCPVAQVGAPGNKDLDIRWVVIPTPDGGMYVNDRDYIIRAANDEFRQCEPDTFAKTYEVV